MEEKAFLTTRAFRSTTHEPGLPIFRALLSTASRPRSDDVRDSRISFATRRLSAYRHRPLEPHQNDGEEDEANDGAAGKAAPDGVDADAAVKNGLRCCVTDSFWPITHRRIRRGRAG